MQKIRIVSKVKILSNIKACELPNDAKENTDVVIEYFSNKVIDWKANNNCFKLGCECSGTQFRQNGQGLFVCNSCGKIRYK